MSAEPAILAFRVPLEIFPQLSLVILLRSVAPSHLAKDDLHENFLKYSHQPAIVTLYWDVETFSDGVCASYLHNETLCIVLRHQWLIITALKIIHFVQTKKMLFIVREFVTQQKIFLLSPTSFLSGRRGEVQDYLERRVLDGYWSVEHAPRHITVG